MYRIECREGHHYLLGMVDGAEVAVARGADDMIAFAHSLRENAETEAAIQAEQTVCEYFDIQLPEQGSPLRLDVVDQLVSLGWQQQRDQFGLIGVHELPTRGGVVALDPGWPGQVSIEIEWEALDEPLDKAAEAGVQLAAIGEALGRTAGRLRKLAADLDEHRAALLGAIAKGQP